MKLLSLLLAALALTASLVAVYLSPLPERHGLHATPRSPKWPEVRAAHLKLHPVCEVCGTASALQVHHIKPFHGPDGQALELEPTNLITLCDSPSCKSHLTLGHLGNYELSNPYIVEDAARLKARREEARK